MVLIRLVGVPGRPEIRSTLSSPSCRSFLFVLHRMSGYYICTEISTNFGTLSVSNNMQSNSRPAWLSVSRSGSSASAKTAHEFSLSGFGHLCDSGVSGIAGNITGDRGGEKRLHSVFLHTC